MLIRNSVPSYYDNNNHLLSVPIYDRKENLGFESDCQEG
jgi:hypothetical protein